MYMFLFYSFTTKSDTVTYTIRLDLCDHASFDESLVVIIKGI